MKCAEKTLFTVVHYQQHTSLTSGGKVTLAERFPSTSRRVERISEGETSSVSLILKRSMSSCTASDCKRRI